MIAKLRMSRSGVMEGCKIRSATRRINATAKLPLQEADGKAGRGGRGSW